MKSLTQNYHPISLSKRMKVWLVCPTTLLELPQNWVICIQKGGPNNFAQVTSMFGNLYWKLLIIKKILVKYMLLKFFLAII